MTICEVSEENFKEWVLMGVALWPGNSEEDLVKEFKADLASDKCKTFLYCNESSEPIAFINLSLRSDYVEGSSSSPVGYIEGIYVKPAYRQKEVATQLVQRAEQWAKERGCSELGSDTELS